MKKMKKEIILLGILIISFIGVFPSIGRAWPPSLPNGDTVILVHGKGDSPTSMNYIYNWAVDNDYPIITWEHVFNIEYYGDKSGHPSEFNNVLRGSVQIQWIKGATIEKFASDF